jgi:oligopeptide/dipeptide ABC transporter ATP-binding protein
LNQVAIPQADRRIDNYPHELSGGMRQRVMIAMAIANEPEVLIADEPTTALDVTVQAQIMELLTRLRQEHHLALVLITHDLGVVAGSADRVAVMYAGRMVERAGVLDVFDEPQHPYTRALLECLPRLDRRHEVVSAIPGTPPNPADLPPGCPFAPRCPLAVDACTIDEPSLILRGRGEVACSVVTAGAPV